MKLIWTLDFNNKIDGAVFDYKERLIDFYKFSITKAKKLGYYTIIYTNQTCLDYFVNLVDEVIITETYENSPFFDSFKFKVLEERNDDFYLIDGDLLLENKLPIYDVDVTFDAYETKHYKETYGEPIIELLKLGYIDDPSVKFDPAPIKVFNCGLLRIKDQILKYEYIKQWKAINQFVIKHKNNMVHDQTAVAAQYLLTYLVSDTKHSYRPISGFLGRKNQYYRHYHGNSKYKIDKEISKIKTLI
jgi:hypothetical protein